MKISILGSGVGASQLTGIANRALPAYVVEAAGERILFECGEGTRFRLEAMGFNYADIHHIAISHPHPDHNALIHFLQSTFCHGLWDATGPRNESWDIYCPKHIVDNFPAAWNYYIPDRDGVMFDYPNLHCHNLSQTEEILAIGDAKLSARNVHHGDGRADALAFRLEAEGKIFAYSGDSGDCPGLRTVAQDADFFICEASARVGDDASATGYGHLSPFKAGEIARAANVKKLVLVHYVGHDSVEAMTADCRRSGFAGEIVIGQDGQIHTV